MDEQKEQLVVVVAAAAAAAAVNECISLNNSCRLQSLNTWFNIDIFKLIPL